MKIQADVLLLLFQHVSASCLGVFCLILSIGYLPLHHSRCQNYYCDPPLSSLCSRQTFHLLGLFGFVWVCLLLFTMTIILIMFLQC